MKLREHIEDFIVDEVTPAQFGPRGDFLVARLEKNGLGTLEAIREVARKLGISVKRVSFGGLKDARSISRQYLSIAPGSPPAAALPKRLQSSLWSYEALGRMERPYDRSSYIGNSFELVLRDLSAEECRRMAGRVETLRENGFCNYYDSQRFGSLEGADHFLAKLLIDGDYEGALKAAIAAPRPGVKAESDRVKSIVRDHWGNWPECKAALPPSRERSIITYLCDHSVGFVHAFELLDRPLRLLYTGAYQSFLWNRVLSRLVTRLVGEARVHMITDLPGGAAMFDSLNYEERAFLKPLIIPQPTPKLYGEAMDAAVRAAWEEILAADALTPRSFKLKKVRSTYFQKGRRAAVIEPRGLEVSQAYTDDLNAGRKKIVLKCELPRGAYVTMLVRALI